MNLSRKRICSGSVLSASGPASSGSNNRFAAQRSMPFGCGKSKRQPDAIFPLVFGEGVREFSGGPGVCTVARPLGTVDHGFRHRSSIPAAPQHGKCNFPAEPLGSASRQNTGAPGLSELVNLRTDGGVAVITLDNPPVNAMKHEVRA